MLARLSLRFLKALLKALSYGLAGGFLVLLIVFVWYLDNRPDLNVWHTAILDAEFTEHSPVTSFADYLALETRLFRQLDEQVYARIDPTQQSAINRYHRDSLSDPERWSPNWNRSFELHTDNPKAGVLLLHGLSDSPYSLRTLAQQLHQTGNQILGLRIPGHGTAPSGLVEVRWQDMAAAVRLAMRHLYTQAGGQPVYIVGYSNGGALAVNYALETLTDPALPELSGLVLLSPAIGVSPAAALAVWQARIGHLLGLEKLAWNSITPEYDPFKYNSFAVNAADLEYRLTHTIQKRITSLTESNALSRFPPVLAFQSVVDATVSTPALVANLFARLPENGHELVLFDINRTSNIEPVLRNDPQTGIDRLLNHPDLNFALSLISNESAHSARVLNRHKAPHTIELTETALNLHWPRGIYSLSHIALPFPADDPLYGGEQAGDSPGIRLGQLALRGERGVLRIGAADMLRLHWNPFYPYLERRLLDVVGVNAGI